VDRTSALVYLINHVICRHERGEVGIDTVEDEQLSSYLGEMYKDLVNTILQRYKVNNVLIENLF
jgi:hypothetical protein